MKSKTEKIKADKRLSLIADDLDNVSSISVIADMDGGKLLIKSLVKDIISSVDTLCAKYGTLTTQEFVGLSADMKSKIDLVRVLKNSKKNKEYLHDLLEQELLAVEEE